MRFDIPLFLKHSTEIALISIQRVDFVQICY